MDSFGNAPTGYPLRNGTSGYGRTPNFNEPPGGERGGQPMPMQPYANGILSRPGGGANASGLQREDSLASLSVGSTRPQQPSHEVFMVREAGSTRNTSGSTAQEKFTGGSRFQQENESALANSGGDRQSHRHHREERGERDRDKEQERNTNNKLPLPKMLKIAVVGDSTVGKTAICNAFTSEGFSFSRNYHMTTGATVYAKSVKLPSRNDESTTDGSSNEDPIRVNLILVDSSGKDIYKEMLPQYWDKLDGIAVVIDLTSSSSLQTASDWLSLAKGCLSSSNNQRQPPNDGSGDQLSSLKRDQQLTLGVLIGSKADLKDLRVISPKAAQDFASQNSLQYFECSAKENSGLEEPFFYLAHQWALINPNGGNGDKENLQDSSTNNGGIFGIGNNRNAGANNASSSRRSTFASRQGSSEGF